MNEETGTMTLLEITRMMEYLRLCGLSYEQIYECSRTG